MNLPIDLSLEMVSRVEDTWTYAFELSIPEDERSRITAIVETDLDGNGEIRDFGLMGIPALDASERDRLAVMLFKLAYSEMLSNDGSTIYWRITDISKLIKNQLSAPEAATLCFVLGTYVNVERDIQPFLHVRVD